jgi:hypothetical protein
VVLLVQVVLLVHYSMMTQMVLLGKQLMPKVLHNYLGR